MIFSTIVLAWLISDMVLYFERSCVSVYGMAINTALFQSVGHIPVFHIVWQCVVDAVGNQSCDYFTHNNVLRENGAAFE